MLAAAVVTVVSFWAAVAAIAAVVTALAVPAVRRATAVAYRGFVLLPFTVARVSRMPAELDRNTALTEQLLDEWSGATKAVIDETARSMAHEGRLNDHKDRLDHHEHRITQLERWRLDAEGPA